MDWRAALAAALQVGASFLVVGALVGLLAFSAYYLHLYAWLGLWATAIFCALWGYAYSYERGRR